MDEQSFHQSNWLMLSHHRPEADPRLEWICNYSGDNVRVSILACDLHIDREVCIRDDKKGTISMTVPTLESFGDAPWIPRMFREQMDEPVVRILASIMWHQWQNKIGILNDNVEHLSEKHSINLYYKTQTLSLITATLVTSAERVSNFHGIIAASFETLLAGALLKLIHKCPLIFDAHEYHSEEDHECAPYSRKVWKNIEKTLLGYTDARFIVSPGLASIAESEMETDFVVLPNATPCLS